MRTTRLVVVVCALLALPSALLAQKRQRNHASSNDPVRIAPTGVTAHQRSTIGRLQRSAKSEASWIMHRRWVGPTSLMQVDAQAGQIRVDLGNAIFDINEADNVATASQKLHLKDMRSDDEAAAAEVTPLLAELQEPKPDLAEIQTFAQKAFAKIQEAVKINANKDNWSK